MKLPSNSKHIQNFSDSLINADTPLHDLPAAASFAQVYARIEGIRILFCVFPEWKFYDDGRVHADPEFQIQNAKPFVPALIFESSVMILSGLKKYIRCSSYNKNKENFIPPSQPATSPHAAPQYSQSFNFPSGRKHILRCFSTSFFTKSVAGFSSNSFGVPNCWISP